MQPLPAYGIQVQIQNPYSSHGMMKSHEIIPIAMIQDLHWILNVILSGNLIRIQNPYS